MKRQLPVVFVGGALALSLSICPARGASVPVGLGGFAAIPAGMVELALEGTSAAFREDYLVPEQSPVSLEHGSLTIPSNAVALRFNYRLDVAAGGEDYGHFYLADLSTPSMIIGGCEGIYAGDYSIHLYPFQGRTVPVLFDLICGFRDVGMASTLTIADVVLELDNDGDGLPDAWESVRGLNPDDPSDRDTDPDEDGLTNWQEWLCGTEPGDPLSVLKVWVLRDSSGGIQIQFTAMPFVGYVLQCRSNLITTAWWDERVIAPQPGTHLIQIPKVVAEVGEFRFYRISLGR